MFNIWFFVGAAVWFFGWSIGIRLYVNRNEYEPFSVGLLIALSSLTWPIALLAVIAALIVGYKK